MAPVTPDAPEPAPEASAPEASAPEASAPEPEAADAGGTADDPSPPPAPKPKSPPKQGSESEARPEAKAEPDASPEGAPETPSGIQVTLSSLPLGASVKLFGRVICTTPCSTEVPVGSHLVEFSLPDGRTAQEVINVSASATSFGHRFAPQ
jgi:hypothetical protein